MRTLHSDKAWKQYGKHNPYFGVIGTEEYLNENLNEQIIDDFFASGYKYVKELFAIIHSKIDPAFKAERILDFGCGPGRLVIPFSKYTKEVIGIDVSQKMIDEAQKNCLKYNVTNASFLLSDDDIYCIKDYKFDLVNSFIVLQHINLKRGEKLIKLLIKSLKVNGIGVLHLTYYDNYSTRRIVNYFRNRLPYLSIIIRLIRSLITGKQFRNLPQMQMNNYNLNKIFAFLQKADVKEVYSSFTDHGNYWGVILIFKKK
ncbi:MAG: class I SAM-dependent methyltransferase [Bacteroidales bacterium]|nr:class I SAM-dependent methyltransferase [Bacteroidales bacterium]